MKYILVIGDGMADHPLDTLGGRTPLEASKKDAIDALARHGILGSVRNVPEGFAPGSDTAIMSIFGCSPRKYFFGRAPLEAAASGIQLAPGDACYRCNMVTYADEDVPFEHKHIISHSAGSISGSISSLSRTDNRYTEEKSLRCKVGYTIADRSSLYQSLCTFDALSVFILSLLLVAILFTSSLISYNILIG